MGEKISDIQLCIVTGQALANLIPILQYRPDRVALVVSGQMKDEADRLIQTLKSVGWEADRMDLFAGLPAEPYDAILQYAMDVHEQLESRYPGARITYNATGGTKLMALAFSHWFGSDDVNDVIYADTSNHRIEYVSSKKARAEPMQAVLNLEIYLKAQGKTLRARQDQDPGWQEKAQLRKQATRYLAENAGKLGGLVKLLNEVYVPDNNKKVAPAILRLEHPPRSDWRKALALLEQGEVFEMGDSIQEWYPKSRDAAVYLSGAWLEEYVWFAAKDAGANEVGLSVTFTDDSDRKSDIRNEIDVAVVHDNQLLLIECKTGNTTRDQKDQDIVYKLDSLSDQAGGSLGSSALISFRPLEHTTKNGRLVNARARASSVDVHTCEHEQLSDLRALIKNWMDTGNWIKPL